MHSDFGSGVCRACHNHLYLTSTSGRGRRPDGTTASRIGAVNVGLVGGTEQLKQ